MTTGETRQLMLDIAMNCHRVGNWIADDYEGKKDRIEVFLAQTQSYLDTFQKAKVPPVVDTTRGAFFRVFEANSRDLKNPAFDKNILAERFMTWGNILTHRATILS